MRALVAVRRLPDPRGLMVCFRSIIGSKPRMSLSSKTQSPSTLGWRLRVLVRHIGRVDTTVRPGTPISLTDSRRYRETLAILKLTRMGGCRTASEGGWEAGGRKQNLPLRMSLLLSRNLNQQPTAYCGTGCTGLLYWSFERLSSSSSSSSLVRGGLIVS